MKKVNVFYVFLVLITSLCVFDFATKTLSTEYLYGDKQELVFSPSPDLAEGADLVQELIEISLDFNIDISQYTYINENSLYIYSTNMDANRSISLLKGDKPVQDFFISNKNNLNEKQSGVIKYPFSSDYLRFYNFEQVLNVGLSDQFYISNSNAKINQHIIDLLSDYGEAKIKTANINYLLNVNYTLLLLSLFAYVVFSIIQFSFFVSKKKTMYLLKLWGYSPLKSALTVHRSFLKLQIYLFVTSVVTLLTFLLIGNQTEFLLFYLVILFFILSALIIFTLPLTCFGIKLTYGTHTDFISLKNTVPFKNYNLAAIVLKSLSTIVFISLLSLTINKTMEINDAIKDNDYWERTENVYRMTANMATDVSLITENKYNKSLNELYNYLEKDAGAFLVYAGNFQEVNYDKDVNYVYEMNDRIGTQEFSPYSRSIIINSNYLLYNPIKTIDGSSIEDHLESSENVLNVLVPKKYAISEREIYQAYLEEFYFSKVEVENIYNNAQSSPMNRTNINELEINLIYVENNQLYFAYNSDIGDYDNGHFIKDPVTIILDGEYDSSAIAAYMTTSVFFVDDSDGEPFEKIKPFLEKTGTNSFVNEVQSVYKERSIEINQMNKELLNYSIGLLMTIVLLIVFLFIFTFSYFKHNAYKLALKTLFGFSYWNRYAQILIGTISANIAASLLVYILYLPLLEIFFYTGLLIIIEVIILTYLFSVLTKKQLLKTVKS